jgi:putative flippase GtrA
MIPVQLKRQIFYFVVIGITATITNYVAALLFHEKLEINLYSAQLLGYCCAVGISLVGHSKLTFNTRLSSGVILKFIVVSVSTLWLSELLLYLLETLIVLSHRISLLIVVSTIPVMTFLLSKLWVFQARTRAV